MQNKGECNEISEVAQNGRHFTLGMIVTSYSNTTNRERNAGDLCVEAATDDNVQEHEGYINCSQGQLLTSDSVCHCAEEQVEAVVDESVDTHS